jgi:hypothetical protein
VRNKKTPECCETPDKTPQEIAWIQAQSELLQAARNSAHCEVDVVAAARDRDVAVKAACKATDRYSAALDAKDRARRDLGIAITRLHESNGGAQ